MSQIELYHRTYDLISNLRLEACLMRTPQFRGYSPYWGDKIIVYVYEKKLRKRVKTKEKKSEIESKNIKK